MARQALTWNVAKTRLTPFKLMDEAGIAVAKAGNILSKPVRGRSASAVKRVPEQSPARARDY